MKRITILGSTGSIGVNTLRVAEHLSEELEVVALAAGTNIDLLEQQAKAIRPKLVAVSDAAKAKELASRLPQTEVLGGTEGVEAVASFSEADMVVSAITGTKGLGPTVAAIRAGKDVALANKEALISGGALVTQLAREKNVAILPVDSEHSAIFQCLRGQDTAAVRRIILTASGGPFRRYSNEQLESVSVEDALNHPSWAMGPKITVDCSTLMNKGLELIEAFWLFGVKPQELDVVVHPQSFVHSFVEFIDGSLLAQVGEPSMVTPIQYALTFPHRRNGLLDPLDFSKFSHLEFYAPDTTRFRCLDLAYRAIEAGNSMPGFMNAANEVLVHRFLNRQLPWKDIATKLETLMEGHEVASIDSLDAVAAIDTIAREKAAMI